VLVGDRHVVDHHRLALQVDAGLVDHLAVWVGDAVFT